MKDMETYFRKIKKQYPQTMSKDQFYQVAHISKATALWSGTGFADNQEGWLSCYAANARSKSAGDR